MWWASNIAAGFVRWVTATIIAGVSIVLGFTPTQWIADYIAQPPDWLVHPLTRVAIVTLGVIAVVAIILVRKRIPLKTATENPGVTYVTDNRVTNFYYEAQQTASARMVAVGGAKPVHALIDFSPSSGMVISNSYNVSSLTDIGTNDYIITFATDFPSDRYAVVPLGNTRRDFEIVALTLGSAHIRFSGSDEPERISLKFEASEWRAENI